MSDASTQTELVWKETSVQMVVATSAQTLLLEKSWGISQANQSSNKCSLAASQDENQKTNHLKYMHTNARSLGNKQKELELHAQSESYDIIGITETWWDDPHDWRITMDGYRLLWKDRQGRRGGIVLYVKENLECIEVNCGDCGSPIKCLWVKIRGVISKGDLTVGICYQPPNQDDKANEPIFGSLKQASGQQNLVLMGNFNYPDICWKNNTAAHMSPIKFLECIEDCFLIQMLDVPTRNEALLDLLLTNQENLFCNIAVSDSLGCSDHSIVEFGILLSTLKRSVSEMEKQRENYKGIASVCRDAVRKAKAQLELKLARDVKNNKKGFFGYVNNKQKQKENIGPMLNRRGELVTNNAEKAEVLNTFFTSIFTSTVGLQTLGTKIQVDANTDPPSVREELVGELLQKLDPYKSMGPDVIHLRVLRELADIVARPLSIIFEKLWRSRDVPEDWKKANATPIYKKGLKEDPENYRPIGLTSVLGKVMERILLGAITSQMKHVIGKSQHGFPKAKSCLTNLIAFYNKVTCSVDVRQVVDIVYLDFSKAFNAVSHSLLLEKLMHYALDKWSVLWVGNWLTGRTQRVVVNSAFSN
ncbi:hypothetical protein QYF61_027293 [Mycteria americana]|uniref:Reverse transcriptase domain-containing protein n=1 Tax=Mycteria americana TaxID=33587 RepID=A0AAN7RMN4_MYCAM|nr:hypothetical protein QYF61_027293 [Mycteria americana]